MKYSKNLLNELRLLGTREKIYKLLSINVSGRKKKQKYNLHKKV